MILYGYILGFIGAIEMWFNLFAYCRRSLLAVSVWG